MSEMVERVAVAICPWSGKKHADCPSQCRVCVANAMSAIEAMREPTKEMLSYEVADSMVHPSCHMCGGHLEGWKLMIEAALKD